MSSGMTDPLLALLTSDDAFSQAMNEARDDDDVRCVHCRTVTCHCPDPISAVALHILGRLALRWGDTSLVGLCVLALGDESAHRACSDAWWALVDRVDAMRWRADNLDSGDPGLRRMSVREAVTHGLATTDGRYCPCDECGWGHPPRVSGCPVFAAYASRGES